MALVATSCVMIAGFALWWFNLSHIASNFKGYYRIFDVLLFICLTFIIWHPILMQVLTWSIASHIKKRIPPMPETGKKVAFVTTFVPGSESVSLLERTLPAIVNVQYPHDTWLLDEGNDPEVRELCERYGVHHFSRHGVERYNVVEGKYARKTKGGNHNSWYDAHGNNYDYVAQIDTDFIPHKLFLIATLGFFKDPKVAFVGTPQVYGNEKESIIAKGAAQQTFNFYGTILRGMDGMDSTLLIGANHVIRVAALKDVDHYSPHITEDLLTGMKLHAKGWKSIYVPKVLAVGEGPIAWKAYFNQQKRWAYGCMHILFRHSFKLFKTMGLRRTIYYFFMQQHYFGGVAMGLSVVCLVLYFAFGIKTSNLTIWPFLPFYALIIGVLMIMQFWLQHFNVRPRHERGFMFAGMYINLAAWPIFLMAFLSLFKRKKLVYKVTPKGEKARKQKEYTYKLFAPHYVIALFAALCVGEYFVSDHRSHLMLFWAVLTVFLSVLVPIVVPISIALRKAVRKFKRGYGNNLNQVPMDNLLSE